MSELTAADVIAEACETVTDKCVNRYPEQAVYILAELAREGFVVVRLPEPDHYVGGCPVWETCLISSDAGVVLDETGCERSPNDARLEAATLLAAAAKAEGVDQ